MRRLSVCVLALLGCGDSNKDKVDAPVGCGSGAFCDAPNVTPDAPPVPACANPVSGSTIKPRKIGTVSGPVTLATSPPSDPRLFVIEQNGRLRIFNNEQLVDKAFLDISDIIVAGGEQGLLGLAFHPNFAQNGKFYVDYTANNPTSGGDAFIDVVAEYKVSASDPNVADPTSAKILLSISDFASNHNGGMLEFGSDGFLYVSTGDGGNAGDPKRNGQNKNALLAKILRIDVDHPSGTKPYGIPTDNPFATGGGAPEVFVYGLRNPWRWSFDRATGDMWIGDVGQNITEEVDVLVKGKQAGMNLGWSAYEANACCATQSDKCSQTGTQQSCDMTGLFFPQDSRAHSTGWNAIIGGQVYRGTCFPDLVGWYFYTDNGHGGMSKAKLKTDGTLEIHDLTGTFPSSPSSLHADSRGELYETDTSGNVWAIEASP